MSLRAVNLHPDIDAISGSDLGGLIEVRKRKVRLIDMSEEVVPAEAFGDVAQGRSESAVA